MTRTEDRTLELPPERMRELVAEASRRVLEYVESLPSQPAAATEGAAELARSLIEPLPQDGRSLPELLDFLFQKIIPRSFNTAGPGYLAYIPGGGLFHSAVADFVASATNRYVGVWAAAPALAQLEANVIRWFCEIVGYPAEARGVLTSGGSLATFSALVTARRERLPENFLKGTLYTSDQAHHSVQKAAVLAGFPEANVRLVPTDETFRIRIDALRQQLSVDRAAGFKPFLIVAQAGSTNTGAVDDLQALADLARDDALWLHVDAAYGGFFMLTERGRARLKGLDRADSLVLDPHKGLFVPYGTGCLLVRDGQALRRAHSHSAAYMPVLQEDPDFVDFCEYSPELSRSPRGLRVWLPLKMHGIAPFRNNLEEKLDLTEWATEELRRIDGIEILAEPQLSVVAFRLARPGLDVEALNQVNRRLLALVNARQRVHLTGTVLGDRFAIRICVLSFRSHRDRVEMGLQDIRDAVDEA